MPKAQPQNPTRTFKTRTTGIFKKASYLHEFDESIRIAIIIEKPGSVPLVFTSEEDNSTWPPLLQDYVSHVFLGLLSQLKSSRWSVVAQP